MQIYVHTLSFFSYGTVLQWKVRLSKRIKSPAFEFTFKILFKGYFFLSYSGIKNQLSL